MRIIQTVNDTIRLLFNPKTEVFSLSDFLLVRDSDENFLAQVVEVYDDKFDQEANVAKIKLIYRIVNGNEIKPYDNYTPSRECEVAKIKQSEIEKCINLNKKTITIGKSFKTKEDMELNVNFFDDNCVIYADKFEQTNRIFETLSPRLSKYKNVLILDFSGSCKIEGANTYIAGENFRLPLSYDTIDYIRQKSLMRAKLETQVVLGDVFEEVKKFLLTDEEHFIPYNKFVKVVQAQCKATPSTELLVLLSWLKKYAREGIFAKNKREAEALFKSAAKNKVTILDLSNLKTEWQKEHVEHILSRLENDVFVLMRLNDNNINNDILNFVYLKKKNISFIPSFAYGFKKASYISEFAQNYILMPTINPKRDFAHADFQIQSLNKESFMIFGEDTKDFIFTLEIENPVKPKENEDKDGLFISLNLQLEDMTPFELRPNNFEVKPKETVKKRLQEEIKLSDVLGQKENPESENEQIEGENQTENAFWNKETVAPQELEHFEDFVSPENKPEIEPENGPAKESGEIAPLINTERAPAEDTGEEQSFEDFIEEDELDYFTEDNALNNIPVDVPVEEPEEEKINPEAETAKVQNKESETKEEATAENSISEAPKKETEETKTPKAVNNTELKETENKRAVKEEEEEEATDRAPENEAVKKDTIKSGKTEDIGKLNEPEEINLKETGLEEIKAEFIDDLNNKGEEDKNPETIKAPKDKMPKIKAGAASDEEKIKELETISKAKGELAEFARINENLYERKNKEEIDTEELSIEEKDFIDDKILDAIDEANSVQNDEILPKFEKALIEAENEKAEKKTKKAPKTKPLKEEEHEIIIEETKNAVSSIIDEAIAKGAEEKEAPPENNKDENKKEIDSKTVKETPLENKKGISLESSEEKEAKAADDEEDLDKKFDEIINTEDDSVDSGAKLKINEKVSIDLDKIKKEIKTPERKLPVFDEPEETDGEENSPKGFVEGGVVSHEKYGEGKILKVINYGQKCLLQIEFPEIGKRLLDPKIAKLKIAEEI